MGNNQGDTYPKDAYPDPKRMLSGRPKLKVVVCIGLLLICFGSLVGVVSAPGPPGDVLPDPKALSTPIPLEHHNTSMLLVENQTVHIV